MKITLVNHSDTRGGASVVTLRLMDALRREGADARMIVIHKETSSPYVSKLVPEWRHTIRFLSEHLRIFLHNGFSREHLFKVSIATAGMPLHRHPWIKDADIVALNWINQGMLSFRGIEAIHSMGKPIVWTMHDMWNLTGICHHAGTCDRFKTACGNCPLLRNGKIRDDLSRTTWQRKMRLYSQVPIRFVAVSNWLAQKCRQSPLMSGQKIHVIPNAFPIEKFPVAPILSRKEAGLPEGKKIIVMGAARLDDPIKGLPIAIDALNMLRRDDSVAVFFGKLRDPAAFDRLHFPFMHIGPISDTDRLQSLYAHASVVLSTSLYETLPGTLIEGMSSGCQPVTFGRGGQSDIVDHLSTGYIAEYMSAGDIANGIDQALSLNADRTRLHDMIASRFSSQTIARRYIELFSDILTTHRPQGGAF